MHYLHLCLLLYESLTRVLCSALPCHYCSRTPRVPLLRHTYPNPLAVHRAGASSVHGPITNPAAKGLDRFHPGYVHPRETWNELDGGTVQFSSDHRPGACYLYWRCCKMVLRHVWADKGTMVEKALMREGGKQFWGTKGLYVEKRMLLAFVGQLGHGPRGYDGRWVG